MKTFLALLLIAVAGGGWWYFHRQGAEAPQYQTVTVTRGDLTQMVTATGTLNPVINVTVGSQVSGNIQKLYADFNSPVTSGQVVAQLDPSTYQAVVHQNEGDVAQAEAALQLTQLTAKRKEDLVAQKAAPQADLDSALAALRQAEATLRIKRANLEKAQVDLERCTIRSPVDGTVISRKVDVGQTVAAAMNAPELFIIANDLTKMQINTNVAEADVGMVEEDQPVDFSVDAYPYQTFHGRVAQVRNAATTVQNVVTYDVVIAVDNADLKLKPGMTANVSIIVAQREDALKVANAGLRFRPPDELAEKSSTPSASPGKSSGGRRGGKGRAGAPKNDRTIYVLPAGGGNPEPVNVKLGINDGLATEVLDGLKEGDVVVTAMTTTAKESSPTTNPLIGGPPRRR